MKEFPLLNDGPELKLEMQSGESTGIDPNALILSLPIRKPDVAYPVIELSLE
jgi:hypothetical protein